MPKIKSLRDNRKRRSIPFANPILITRFCFLLQYKSFHEIFTYQTTRNRIKNLVRGRIPKTDAAREILIALDVEELKKIHESVIATVYKNKGLRKGRIDGYTVVAIDGVELLGSYPKHCDTCLTREHENGKTEWFHRSVLCMTVGSRPPIILGEDRFVPRDGDQKDEGERTGGKRLIRSLYEKHHHFADVIVADALYLNAPFIKVVKECHMHVVIRMKNENSSIFRDAKGLFEKEGKKEGFVTNRIEVNVWDLKGFELTNLEGSLRILKFEEKWPKEKGIRTMWVATDRKEVDGQTIGTRMHKRWDIEHNGFHQLKTYYHAGHCYVHKAVETILLLQMLAFNIREMYLHKRMRRFQEMKITLREVTERLRDEVLLHNYCALIDDG